MNNGWKEIACLMMLYLPVSILLQLTKQENALKNFQSPSIELKYIEGLMEDLQLCQISSLSK